MLDKISFLKELREKRDKLSFSNREKDMIKRLRELYREQPEPLYDEERARLVKDIAYPSPDDRKSPSISLPTLDLDDLKERFSGYGVIATDCGLIDEKRVWPRYVFLNGAYCYLDEEAGKLSYEYLCSLKVGDDLVLGGRMATRYDVAAWLIEVEFDVGFLGAEKLGKDTILLLDRDFSSEWLRHAKKAYREVVLGALVRKLNEAKERKIVPIGITDTRAYPVVNYLIRCGMCADVESCRQCSKNSKPCELRGRIHDSCVLNGVLREWERSPEFRRMGIITSELSDMGVQIDFFYVKTKGGILRVEYPSWAKEKVDRETLHALVVYECQKGNGRYPYLMERAHEFSLVTGRDREFARRMIAKEAQLYDLWLSPKRAVKEGPFL